MAAEIILRALKHVWVSLAPLNMPMAVMGGLALAAWKHVRATQDVDLLIGIGQTDPDMILSRLAQVGVRPKRQPPIQRLGQLRLLQLLYEPPNAFMDLQVDLLFAESKYHQEALERRIPMQLSGLDMDVFVLTCEDLIIHKLLAGRIVDRADAAALLRANRGSLDIDYLVRSAGELKFQRDLAEIWGEAFPGERTPFREG